MINKARLISAGVAACIAASAYCAAPGNRVFYGFTLGSAEFADAEKEYDYGFVSYPFDPTEDDAEIYGDMLNSYYDSKGVGVYAGAGVDGLIYACEYVVTGSMMPPQAGNLIVYNTFNGLKESIGMWNPDQTDFKPQDMSWSEKEGKMYAVGYESSASGLYTLDLETAKFTRLCTIGNGGATLAVHPNGTLYSLSTSGVLYTLDPATGKAVKVMDTGLSGMPNNQSMEFDKASGLLYWVSSTFSHPLGYDNSWLQEIDVNAHTIREVGSVGIGARFVAMHIPSAENLMAPSAPTAVSSTPAADGTLAATISWTNPTVTLSGSSEIGNLYGYIIDRNGERVKICLSSDEAINPGETMSWTDTSIPATGNYRYDIYLFNGKGNGAKGTVFQYIGPDAPGPVSKIAGDVADNMRSLTLTWNAPVNGLHLGAYDPSTVRYTVTRNDNLVVGKDLKECKVVDNDFVRVMKYSYTVTAHNDMGSSDVVSEEYILGPAFELPFEQTFENPAQVENLWTSVDANDDGFSWLFNTTIGQAAFGDFESAAEYIVSPGLGNSNAGVADDWLISPPLEFEEGVEYEVTVSSRSYTTDEFEIWLGGKNYVADMTQKLGSFEVEHDPDNPDIDPTLGTVAFRRRSVEIPVFNDDVVKCVGLRLVTKHPTHGYFQINGIFVGEKGEYSGVEDVAVNGDVNISVNGKLLAIFGTFHSAKLYDLNGHIVLSTGSATADLSHLTSGVYILNVDGKSFKIAL